MPAAAQKSAEIQADEEACRTSDELEVGPFHTRIIFRRGHGTRFLKEPAAGTGLRLTSQGGEGATYRPVEGKPTLDMPLGPRGGCPADDGGFATAPAFWPPE